MKLVTVVACLSLLVAGVPLIAQEKKDHQMLTPEEMKWAAGPAALPKGSQVTVLKGNPAEEGVFTIRVRMPANYRIPAHWHPAFENITVIEGSFSMGLGDRFDEASLHEMKVGAFMTMSPGTRHFGMAKNGAVIQLHGMGPWQVYYVNAADDPRRPAVPPK